ncbi:radical SAM/SPASM domain-containing protein [Clostridium sp. UBA5119]|uniref:radical SAM/SPASM domain-containing protein n=1 Tax=Clostridium sp. UBA5119 TaxID=1946366 RepID=UPI00321764E7
MYYSKNNVYINEDSKILFDLTNMDIFELDDKHFKIFNNLYFNKEQLDINNDNETLEMYNMFFKRSSEKPLYNDYIKSIRINVSNTCNLNCTYCYANQGNYHNEDGVMTIDTAEKICNYITTKFPKADEISFFGGEPFLNVPVIEYFCKYFSDQKPTSFAAVTNLTILSDDIINLINKYSIKITGSIDGPKEINDIYRKYKNGDGTFDTISENIHKINRKTSKAIKLIESTYTKQSFEKYSKQELLDFFYNNYGIKNILIADVLSDDNNISLPSKCKSENVEQIIENTFESILKNQPVEGSLIISLLLFFNKNYNDNFCNAGVREILIDHQGEIWPCQAYINREDFYMGSIYNNDDTTFNKVNTNLKTIGKSNLTNCYDCVARYWCSKCIAYTSLTDSNKESYYNEAKCNYNKLFTEKVLNKLCGYIKSEKLNLLIKNLKEIVEV